MRIGFCGKPEIIRDVAAAGFDYIEMPLSYIASLTKEDYETVRRGVADSGICSERFNVLFPGEIRLLNDGILEQVSSYLDNAFDRMTALGGKIIVFGSGRSRMRPEAMSYPEAFRRLTDLTGTIGSIAEKHGVTIAVEPLNRNECNMINSVAEGACLCAAVNHPHVKLLADYYHIALEHEPPMDIERVSGIVHAHIATLEGRRIPLAADDGYRQMFHAMKATDYTGTISVEGKCDNLLIEGPKSISLLKTMWEEA